MLALPASHPEEIDQQQCGIDLTKHAREWIDDWCKVCKPQHHIALFPIFIYLLTKQNKRKQNKKKKRRRRRTDGSKSSTPAPHPFPNSNPKFTSTEQTTNKRTNGILHTPEQKKTKEYKKMQQKQQKQSIIANIYIPKCKQRLECWDFGCHRRV